MTLRTGLGSMIRRLGFTGTQHGMSIKQQGELQKLLMLVRPDEFHHGDCIGADEQAHNIALDLGIAIVIHPPKDAVKRAFCQGYKDIWRELSYRRRNGDIVGCASCGLVVAPRTMSEELRSGTWMTYRMAIANKIVPRYVLWPNGTQRTEQA